MTDEERKFIDSVASKIVSNSPNDEELKELYSSLIEEYSMILASFVKYSREVFTEESGIKAREFYNKSMIFMSRLNLCENLCAELRLRGVAGGEGDGADDDQQGDFDWDKLSQ